jgi:hypothetical protein
MTALEVFRFLSRWLEDGKTPHSVSDSTRKRMREFVEAEIRRREKLAKNPGRPIVRTDRRSERNREAQKRYRERKRLEKMSEL